MSYEIDCEEIYPQNRPAICGLCKTVPEAKDKICQARSLIDQTLKGVIKMIGNKNNVTNIRLRAAIGVDPLTGKRTGLIKEVFEDLIGIPAIKTAVGKGKLDNAKIGRDLSGLVEFNLKFLNNHLGNNRSRSLATVSEGIINSYHPRAIGKRAPHSD